ncbi:MAG TPA: GWxTD domain-containing protein [Rhodothermales bacterium]|nr:GWxTD domain-containing protein [Rhodothermales bacterium]
MKTILQLFAFLSLFWCASHAMGQTAPIVQVDLDHAAFAYTADESVLEVYMAFEASSLPFVADEQGFRASVPFELMLMRSTEATLSDTPSDPVWEDTLRLDFVVPDTAALASGQYFFNQMRLPIAPGEYEMRMVLPGDTTRAQQTLELRRDVLVPDFSGSDLVGLSDITLATSIAPSEDRQDVFYKNGLVIRPNANQVFGSSLDKLYYYAEAYNVDEIAGDNGEYTLFAYIAEANRPQPLSGFQRRMPRPARTPDVLAGTFPLDELPSGSYFLRLAILNENNESMAEQARKFFVFNPDVEREQAMSLEASFETSPYATMSEEEVEKGMKHIEMIATDRERQRGKNIQDLDERRRFLMEFWQVRDPNPNTPINEYRDEFYGRLQYANQRYTTSLSEGWNTDRGRVIIKYGTPSQIEPHLYERDSKPYELWEFNNIPGEGQAVFIFADVSSFGEFQLIHSTVTGEVKSPNWEEEVRR